MKGFAAHLVVFAVVAIIGFGLYFQASHSNSSHENVKGASSVSENQNGVSVAVTSRNNSWDLFQYICTDLDECKSKPDSGKRVSVLSGSSVDLKNIHITPAPNWNSYSYLKVYARPSWDVMSDGFNVVSAGDVPDTQVFDLSLGSAKQKVVVMPIESILDTYYKSATFSD